MPREVWYCETNSGHEHSTAWEAENCSRLYVALSQALRDLGNYGTLDYDRLYDELRAVEER